METEINETKKADMALEESVIKERAHSIGGRVLAVDEALENIQELLIPTEKNYKKKLERINAAICAVSDFRNLLDEDTGILSDEEEP